MKPHDCTPPALRPSTSRPRAGSTAALTGLALLPLVIGAVSCGGGGGGSGGGGGAGANDPGLFGSLSVFLPDSTNLEAEPNDTIAQAHQLGSLSAGRTLSVLGTVTQSGSDMLDYFEVTVPERIQITANLNTISPSSDLDLYVFDPVSLSVVQPFATPSSSESGTFLAKGTVFLVVDAFNSDSDYELELVGASIGATTAESEPNDSSPTGDYLGTISPGESVTVTGDGAGGSSDYFLFSVPSGMTLNVDLSSSAGQDYDINVFDATSNLASPSFLGTFDSGPPNESGMVNGPGMTLFAFEVFPFGGATAPYSMQIATSATLVAGGAAPPAQSRLPRAGLAGYTAVTRDPVPLFESTKVPFRSVRGALIVDYADGVERRSGQVLESSAALVGEIPGGPRKLALDVPAELDDEEAARFALACAATLRGRSDVRYAELDPWMMPFALPQGGEVRPNDTFYNLQWHYEQIGLPIAWNTTTGSSAVRVCILDTGSAPCSDLTDIGGIDAIADPQIAGDGNGVDSDPTDVGDGQGSQPSSFHGAHVAGTVGANTNNDYGVAGVSWQTTLMHARVLGIGGGSSFDIANGLLWSAGLPNATGQVASPPADIANMSLGGPGFSQTFQDACTAAWNAGTVVIAAAGNENSSTPSFPAAYDDVISVAAVDFERNKAPYSNFHPTVDIAAPGGDVSVDRNGDGYADGVLSNKPDDSVNPTNFENFSFYQGTSMAAPHVAGVAALILAVDPGLNPDQVDSILRNTATDLGAAGRDNIYGEGLVNAAAAVQLAAGGGGGPVLALDTDAVLLEGAGTRRVGVSNAGTGALDVTSVTTSPPSATWLSATAVATGQAGTTDTSAIDVTANASGLPSGNYAGTVLVDSNGGSRQIAVTLTVGASGPGTSFTVFVLAVDADTFETRAQDVVQTSGSLAYGLGSLPPGRYVVVAGTDEDNDGLICDEGEPLCGLYPSINLATAIDLSDGQRVTGLDFPVQDTSGPTPASAADQTGFRLLTRLPAADIAEGVRQ